MRVYAALVPPEPALAELSAVVAAVAPGTPELDQEPLAQMHIAVSRFGNVSQPDAIALGDALATVVARTAPLRLSFAGGTALEWPGDFSVWAKMAGDTDRLMALAGAAMLTVERLGFFVDRRMFRTWLSVGEVTPVTTVDYLQRLVDALEAYQGPEWTLTELLLVKGNPAVKDVAEARYELLTRLPLLGE